MVLITNLIFVQDSILSFIFKNHEQGFPISIFSVIIDVCSLPQLFETKAWDVKCGAVARFLKKWEYVHRLSTHKSQYNHCENEDDKREWMAMVVPTLVGPQCYPTFIQNMDQMPVMFENSQEGTIIFLSKIITMIPSGGENMRCTATITITASNFNFPTQSSYVVHPLGKLPEVSSTHTLLLPFMQCR